MPTDYNPHPPATPDTGPPSPLRSRARPHVPKALPFELSRPRLISRLSTEAKIIFSVAPSGFGKTTLLAAWARTHTGRHVWFEIRGEDLEPATLLTDLARAVLQSGVTIPNWSALEGTEGQESRLGALLEDLNASPDDVTLILDRAEDLSEDAALLLNDLLLGLGDGHRVLVGQCAGSYLSPLPFLTIGQAEIIDMGELTFSADETQALAAQFPDVSRGQALKIYSENTGWPLGTVLGLHRPVQGHLSGPKEVPDIFQFWKRTSSTTSDLRMRV
jgi:LuxR family maltose regulon positive regulatory protein